MDLLHVLKIKQQKINSNTTLRGSKRQRQTITYQIVYQHLSIYEDASIFGNATHKQKITKK